MLVRLEEQSGRNPGTREFLRHELALLRRDVQSISELVTQGRALRKSDDLGSPIEARVGAVSGRA
jgi:hypothetical protein